MNLETEILLTYHTNDDEPIGGSNKGWVSNFNKFLSTLLEQISGEKPVIRLINEKEADLKAYSNAIVLISLISKSFLVDKNLVAGVHEFGGIARKKDDLVTDGLSRFFKVIKYPLEVDELLPEYSNILTYDFYQIDALTGEPQEFRRFFGNDAERSYWMKLVDMAYDIYQIQNKITEESKVIEEENSDKERTIYLGSAEKG